VRALALTIVVLVALVAALAGTSGAERGARRAATAGPGPEPTRGLRAPSAVLRAGPRTGRQAVERRSALDAPARSVALPDRAAGSRKRAVLEGRVGTSAATLVLSSGPDRGRRIETDATGAFRAEDLAPGLVLVAVQSRELGPAERSVRLSSVRPTRLELVRSAPRTIRGRVVDVTGSPLSGAQVLVDGTPTRTAADGAFAHVQVVAGRPAARVEAEGYATVLAELLAEGERPVEFVLERGARLELRARSAVRVELRSLERARPVRGAAATLPLWSEALWLRAGEQRVLEDLAPGRLRIVTGSGEAQRALEVRLAGAATPGLEVSGS